MGQRRMQSSPPGVGTSTTFLHKHKKENMRKNWLSDPSTYPLIVTMGIAAALVSGVGVSCIFYSPDVQINPNRRGSVLRNWQF
jgi:hypothetical protein